MVEAGYVGSRTGQLETSVNVDTISAAQLAQYGRALNTAVANPFQGRLPGSNLNGATIPLMQTLVPYPQYLIASTRSTNGVTVLGAPGTTPCRRALKAILFGVLLSDQPDALEEHASDELSELAGCDGRQRLSSVQCFQSSAPSIDHFRPAVPNAL